MAEMKINDVKPVTMNDINCLQKQIENINNKIDYCMKDIVDRTTKFIEEAEMTLSELQQKLKDDESVRIKAKNYLQSD